MENDIHVVRRNQQTDTESQWNECNEKLSEWWNGVNIWISNNNNKQTNIFILSVSVVGMSVCFYFDTDRHRKKIWKIRTNVHCALWTYIKDEEWGTGRKKTIHRIVTWKVKSNIHMYENKTTIKSLHFKCRRRRSSRSRTSEKKTEDMCWFWCCLCTSGAELLIGKTKPIHICKESFDVKFQRLLALNAPGTFIVHI